MRKDSTVDSEKESVDIELAWVDYRGRLFSFIRSRVPTDDDAEDILSLAFTKLIASSKNSNPPTNWVPWMYRVIRNVIADYYRERSHLPLPLPELIEEDKQAMVRMSGCVVPLINQLPEMYSEVIFLADVEQMKNKEIAKLLNLSLSAVKSRVLRGREKLLKEINQCCYLMKDNQGDLFEFEQKNARCCQRCE